MSSKTKPFGAIKSIKTVGEAQQIPSGALSQIVDSATFEKKSGKWRGVAVHSLYGASSEYERDKLTLIADSQGHVTVFKTAELGVLAAAMGITQGAEPSSSAKHS